MHHSPFYTFPGLRMCIFLYTSKEMTMSTPGEDKKIAERVLIYYSFKISLFSQLYGLRFMLHIAMSTSVVRIKTENVAAEYFMKWFLESFFIFFFFFCTFLLIYFMFLASHFTLRSFSIFFSKKTGSRSSVLFFFLLTLCTKDISIYFIYENVEKDVLLIMPEGCNHFWNK